MKSMMDDRARTKRFGLRMMIAGLALVAASVAGCKQACPPPAPTPAPVPVAAPASPPASPDHVPPGVNAVQNEMRLLHEAMRDTVSAIALGTLSTIPERLHAVDRARELTEHAVESGTYKLARNGDQLEAFKALDDSFHAELEKLAAGAKANDSIATSTALGTVMGRCEGCHAQFRAPR
ncbi:MAG: cytochrome c [Kofleriaceae bacterium]